MTVTRTPTPSEQLKEKRALLAQRRREDAELAEMEPQLTQEIGRLSANGQDPAAQRRQLRDVRDQREEKTLAIAHLERDIDELQTKIWRERVAQSDAAAASARTEAEREMAALARIVGRDGAKWLDQNRRLQESIRKAKEAIFATLQLKGAGTVDGQKLYREQTYFHDGVWKPFPGLEQLLEQVEPALRQFQPPASEDSEEVAESASARKKANRGVAEVGSPGTASA
jgi:hypothetical protein